MATLFSHYIRQQDLVSPRREEVMKTKSDGYNATIESVREDTERCHTIWITLHHDSGSHQGFGGIVLDGPRGKLTLSFVKDICTIFGTTDFESLKGRRCRALYNFPGWNEPIAGIETDLGRFTIHGWRKRMFPKEKHPSPLRKRCKSVMANIARALT